MLQVLLDSGCIKSILLKSFTLPKARTQLSNGNYWQYKTYGVHFASICIASVGFRLVEFNKNKDLLIKYKFQVDKINKTKDSRYNMIKGNVILYDLGIDLLFSEVRT